jgi:hypothetical protein
MLSFSDLQLLTPILKQPKRECTRRFQTVRFASTVRPHCPRISGLVEIRQIKYCDNNKNATAGKTTFL